MRPHSSIPDRGRVGRSPTIRRTNRYKCPESGGTHGGHVWRIPLQYLRQRRKQLGGLGTSIRTVRASERTALPGRSNAQKQKGERVLDLSRLLPPSTAFCRPLAAFRIHTHLVASLVLVLEFHVTIDHAEQRIVRRATDVRAGMELGAALHHDDASGRHELAPEAFDAQVLRSRVAAVARGANTLLVSHGCLSRPSRRRS